MKAITNKSELNLAYQRLIAMSEAVKTIIQHSEYELMEIVKSYCSDGEGELNMIEGVESIESYDQYDAGEKKDEFIAKISELIESDIDIELASIIAKIVG
jgi:hypothetical protein